MLHERKSRLAEGRAVMSTPEGDLAPIRGRAPRVGGELRAARLQYGWDLEAVAASLRIRVAYLEAVEAGRVADLPGNAYALGFLRTYATALGLDADEMCRRFRAEVAEVNTKTELTFPAPVPERGVPAGAVILLGVALAVGAYVGWYRLAEHTPPAHTAASVPPELARLAEPTALAPKPVQSPAPATPEVSVTSGAQTVGPSAGATGVPPSSAAPVVPPAPAVAPAGAIAPAPAVTATATPSAPQEPGRSKGASGLPAATPSSGGNSSGPGSAATGGTQSATASPTSPPTAATGTSASASAVGSPLAAVSALAPPAQAAPAAPGRIVVRAIAESWIEVRDATGAVVFTKLMEPGESWTAPREAGLTLTTGNAGGTQLLVDGTVGAPLGVPGEVERNQPLDAGLIKAGALPAQIAAAAAPDAGHPNLRPTP